MKASAHVFLQAWKSAGLALSASLSWRIAHDDGALRIAHDDGAFVNPLSATFSWRIAHDDGALRIAHDDGAFVNPCNVEDIVLSRSMIVILVYLILIMLDFTVLGGLSRLGQTW